MSCLRREVFKDEYIVCSGIIPIGMESQKHPLIRLCIQYGAHFQDRIQETTTVLVAGIDGTE